MLEEIRIQIFVETILELGFARLPIYFVGEFNFGARHQILFAFGGHVDVNDLLAIVADVEFLVRVNEILFVGIVFVADFAPNWQRVNVHLVPVVIFDGVRKRLDLLLRQFDHTDFGGRNIVWILCVRKVYYYV